MEVPAQIWNFGALLKFSTSLLSTSPHRTQWSDCVTSQRNSFSMSVTKRGPDQTQQPIRLDFMKTCHPLVLRFINAPFLGSFPISRESRFVPDFRFTRAKLVDLLSGPTDCYWAASNGIHLGWNAWHSSTNQLSILATLCSGLQTKPHFDASWLKPYLPWLVMHLCLLSDLVQSNSCDCSQVDLDQWLGGPIFFSLSRFR